MLSQEMGIGTTTESTENDIAAVVFAPVKIYAVEEALKREFPEAEVSIYTSGYSGAKTIHLRSDEADFEGYPDSTDGSGADSDYLIEGMIDGEIKEAVSKAKSFFDQLLDAGMKIRYEVYDPAGNTVIEQAPTQRCERADAEDSKSPRAFLG